jgi:hypothetical protein
VSRAMVDTTHLVEAAHNKGGHNETWQSQNRSHSRRLRLRNQPAFLPSLAEVVGCNRPECFLETWQCLHAY